ncbi:MAG: metallophosphoesterase family protein [Sphaerochaetaceae bacterium]|jgi:exonuclease SbcD
MRVLAASDIHIGQSSVTLSDHQRYSGFSAWDAVVDLAIDKEVDLLLLAGDVVHHDDGWYEAYGPLLGGLRRLKEHHIRCVAVAGNHDANVFVQLTKEQDDLITVLGKGGKWDYIDIENLRIIGWSFPSSHYTDDPMKEFDRSFIETDRKVLGLLHTDLDGSPSRSRYAPTSSSTLEMYSNVMWIVGHIHKHSLKENHLMCGSPYSFDSSETGAHGAWLFDDAFDPQFIQLSPHRYETCIVELDEHTTSATIIHYIKQGIDNLIRSLDQKHVPRELYCMLHFTGVLNPEVSFNTLIDANRLGEFHYPISDGINVTVSSSFSEDISYKLDLVSLAKEEGPIGVLSSLLLDPQSNQTVLQDIAELQNQSTQTNAFMLIQDPQITPPSQLLEKAGMRLLRSISEQRERHE